MFQAFKHPRLKLLSHKEFSEEKQVHVGIEASKTKQTRYHNTFISSPPFVPGGTRWVGTRLGQSIVWQGAVTYTLPVEALVTGIKILDSQKVK